MKVICAPDSFKGSLTSILAAEAMAAGVRNAVPGATVDLCPIADGGEGMLAAFSAALPGEVRPVAARGPLGETTGATVGIFAEGRIAIVESAAAAGLQLVPEASRDPESTSSYGVGELVNAAAAGVPERIIVGVGGTATNDGGCGMAQALGVRFFDRHDELITAPLTGGMLGDLSRIDASAPMAALAGIEIVVAADVQNPLTGRDGAAAVYGPQKGATDEQVARLDAGLAHLADLVRRDLRLHIGELQGAGAGGGLGGGLVAFAGARVASGIDTVLEAVDFEQRVQSCDLCLTGEGRIDAQSLQGKACMGVAQSAARHGVPTIALVGSAGPGAERCLSAGLRDYVVIGEEQPIELRMRQTDRLVAGAAGKVARKFVRIRG